MSQKSIHDEIAYVDEDDKFTQREFSINISEKMLEKINVNVVVRKEKNGKVNIKFQEVI